MDIKRRLERIVHIFFLLQSRSVVTNKELQERFHIGRRTVYRDLKVLEQAGVPVINESGQGFSIIEGFRVLPSRFSQEEVLSLMVAEKVMQKHETAFVRQHFETALIKIKGSFRAQQKDHLSHLENKLQINEPFRETKYLPDIIDVLLKSILSKRVVEISYVKSGTSLKVARTIEPVGLFYENGSWYVLAWCRLKSGYRNFRLDRIQRIIRCDDNFKQEHPSVDELRKADSQNNITPVVIAVDPDYAHFLYWERQNYGFSREEMLSNEIIMYFDCRQSPVSFARWFMRFVDVAKILEPAYLPAEVRRILEAGMDNIGK
ncbi:helix-turn-helix transcriptional regulator [Chitinophaga polysaccharea]|uniref:helix-turn-helix transcriptional regulator n=1 Tax=Chitinophaga polysaccharea TaxID=1293035 RepID=UPI001157D28E|nr:WYL domain-containing protein [Chitinophaga polysaccharea]